MIRPTLILLIILLGMRTFSQDAKLIYKNAVNSTVTIETDKGLGSGFFVGKNIIATNYHVIEGATKAYCYTNNSETRYNIEGFLAVDTSTDLVLLKVTGLDRPALKMASKSVVAGQKIFVLGSPKGLPATISDGIVGGLRNFNGYNLIQITAPISTGSSGGPVLNANGELVGVSVGQISSGQNLNFAIPKSYLKSLLNLKINNSTPLSSQPVKTTSSNQGKVETQDWIKEIIESFSHFKNKPEYLSSEDYKYEVAFKDCSITIKKIWKHDAPGLNGGRKLLNATFIYEIPLQSLAKINFIKIKEDYQIVFKIKTNDILIKTTTIVKSEHTDKTENKSENSISLYIPQDMLTNNLPERLTNAFNRLIELCGGKITKDVF